MEDRTPVEVIEDITNSMANADSISVFVDALKSLTLQQEDVAEG
ncbi:hypothetical protein [Parapedobacter koreensis]|nr:hypothetical protein [Parapedobacter koreensis]